MTHTHTLIYFIIIHTHFSFIFQPPIISHTLIHPDEVFPMKFSISLFPIFFFFFFLLPSSLFIKFSYFSKLLLTLYLFTNDSSRVRGEGEFMLFAILIALNNTSKNYGFIVLCWTMGTYLYMGVCICLFEKLSRWKQ